MSKNTTIEIILRVRPTNTPFKGLCIPSLLFLLNKNHCLLFKNANFDIQTLFD